MKRTGSINFWPALASLLLFAGLCAISAYWALQMLVPKPAVAPAENQSEQRGGADAKAVLELFGQPAVAGGAPAASVSNIIVVGITAGDSNGSAILAVDGAPGRFFAIGAKVSERVKLVEVKRGSVIIERSGARIELPAPTVANLSVLTSGVGKTRQGASSPASAPPFGASAVNAMPPQTTAPPPATAMPGQVAPAYPMNQGQNLPPGGISSPGNIPNTGGLNTSSAGTSSNPPGAMTPPPPPGKALAQ